MGAAPVLSASTQSHSISIRSGRHATDLCICATSDFNSADLGPATALQELHVFMTLIERKSCGSFMLAMVLVCRDARGGGPPITQPIQPAVQCGGCWLICAIVELVSAWISEATSFCAAASDAACSLCAGCCSSRANIIQCGHVQRGRTNMNMTLEQCEATLVMPGSTGFFELRSCKPAISLRNLIFICVLLIQLPLANPHSAFGSERLRGHTCT